MKKRVDCGYCLNFVQPVFEEEHNIMSKEIEKAKCNLGKRVMFRKPVFYGSNYIPTNDYGYIRYCADYRE